VCVCVCVCVSKSMRAYEETCAGEGDAHSLEVMLSYILSKCFPQARIGNGHPTGGDIGNIVTRLATCH
jgi:hypothetical protein